MSEQAPPAAEPRPGAAVADSRPNGPVAAVLLATGIGAFVLALLVILAEAKASFAESLAYSDDVGPLAGKTIWAVIAFGVSWFGLNMALRRREVDLQKMATIAAVLLGLGLLGTFAPFFELFAAEE